MAQRTVITLVDDLDGSDMDEGAGETVHFMLDGQSYEMDLSTQNAAQLREMLTDYVNAGRRAGPKPTTRIRRSSSRR